MLKQKNEDIIYIRQDNRKYEKRKTWFLKFLRKVFCKICIENIENGNIILVPVYKKYNSCIRKTIVKQIEKFIEKNEKYKIVLEEKLQFLWKDLNSNLEVKWRNLKSKLQNSENNEYNKMKILNDKYKLELLDGKELMRIYVLEILDYIFNLSNKNINLENIYMCVNEYNKYTTQIIQELINKFKTVNIVTENLYKYKKMEDYIYKNGGLITISNNKKKSLRNAKYILNIDFEKEKMEEYNINNNAIIINLYHKNLDLNKGFSGIIINNFELEIDKNQLDYVNEYFGNLNEKIFIESIFFRNRVINNFSKPKSNQYKTKIVELIGVRGNIQKNEFLA